MDRLISSPQRDAILAGLRFLQMMLEDRLVGANCAEAFDRIKAIHRNDRVEGLDVEGIEALCEHINRSNVTWALPVVTCPTEVRHGDDLVGCGSDAVTKADEEGFRDCADCGLFFKDEGDSVVPPRPSPTMR